MRQGQSDHWFFRRRTGVQVYLLRLLTLAIILLIGIVIPGWFK
jgi:hypothetical protein